MINRYTKRSVARRRFAGRKWRDPTQTPKNTKSGFKTHPRGYNRNSVIRKKVIVSTKKKPQDSSNF